MFRPTGYSQQCLRSGRVLDATRTVGWGRSHWESGADSGEVEATFGNRDNASQNRPQSRLLEPAGTDPVQQSKRSRAAFALRATHQEFVGRPMSDELQAHGLTSIPRGPATQIDPR